MTENKSKIERYAKSLAKPLPQSMAYSPARTDAQSSAKSGVKSKPKAMSKAKPLDKTAPKAEGARKSFQKSATRPTEKPAGKPHAKSSAKPAAKQMAKPIAVQAAKPDAGLAEGKHHDGERIAKVLARAGVCSRREAELLIADGRVKVDGKVLASPALNVTSKNRILIDGQPLPEREDPRVWRYHKSAGLITSAHDPQGRPTVFERLPPNMPRVISVGRLDFNTEGLLLLTNDGELARHLELPANAWVRQYRVRVHGRVDAKKLASLSKGVTISGINYGPVKAELVKDIEARAAGQAGEVASKSSAGPAPSNVWLQVSIREGKNREVRKLMEHLGLQVTRLMRVSFGPFLLGKLERGAVEEVPRKFLRDQLGSYFKKAVE